ncbi:MAG: integrase arm-type DNA-binding domain-containing protein [Burkholderiales bacterium]|jgi:integrase|nr:integrase arm-type DNA-binding domain-containing protein [Burkholderiales bacterium]
MPRHLLTDLALRGIKPGDPRKRLTDGDGLYLLLFVKGGAHGWRLDYSHAGRRKTLSLGTYPDTTLAAARRKADDARRLLDAGTDPSDARKATKAEHQRQREEQAREDAGLPPPGSFEAVAREWLDAVHGHKVSSGHAERTRIRLEQTVFPWLGRLPLAQIGAPQVLDCLRRVEGRGTVETAHRVKQACGQVFRYGIATGRCERDPTADLRDALRPVIVRHHAAVLQPQRVGELLRAVDGYEGQPVTRAALQLAPLLFQRPGELRGAEWAEFDLPAATWTIPPHRMKRSIQGKVAGPAHVVPLSRQAVDILEELHALTGRGRLLFPGLRSRERPISDMTMNAALRRLGFSADEMTSHGWRAMARTLIAERLGIAPDVIEAQLAHAVPDALGRAYNRTEFLDQRRQMMQLWADYLDRLRAGAQVLPFRTA